MKYRLGIIAVAWALSFLVPIASAQGPFSQALQGGGHIHQPAAFQPVQADLTQGIGLPGRIWISGRYADQGLGYVGSYLTLGAKTRMFEDFLDGRWLFEGRGHVSENGGFFGNFGIERIFSIDAAGADISVSGWFDYDDDQSAFLNAETFTAWGASAQIKTERWDLIANGYFPFGSNDSTIGDPTGGNVFFQNRIIVRPGIDSALEGFDVTLRMKPRQLAFVNGSIDMGGYGYESDLVDFFGGGRARLNFQMLRGWLFSGEINYDDRFDLTGVVGLTFVRGGGGRGAEYAGLARDLEITPRNDHIVRFNQEVILAIDPDTGAPYNVIHVDNSIPPGAFEDGDFESPFDTLAEAEAAGMDDDIIFVNEGDGTTTGYEDGIVLSDGQLLLGDGVRHLIPIQGGVLFELSNDQDGIRPTITGSNNGNGVTLANRNTVRGFIIDGNQSVGGMANGIFGGAATTNTDGIIEDNMIIGAILDGIGVTNLAGDWTFARNETNSNGFNGIRLMDACDPTSVFTFDSNTSNNNGLDGIQITNYDAADLVFTGNTTNSNGRDGVRIEGFKGDPNVGVDITFDDQTSRLNNGAGINVIDGDGSVTVMNSIIGNDEDTTSGISVPGGNLGSGISIVDFRTPDPTDRILIMDNDINGNGVGGGAGVDIQLDGGTARALITGNLIDVNGIGIRGIADDTGGVGTVLDIDVIDNVSVGSAIFGGNLTDGMRFITNGGARLNLLVDQTGNNPLTMAGNGSNGITLLAGGTGGVVSNLTAVIRDVTIVGSGSDGVFGSVIDDGQLNLLFENSIVNASGDDAFDFDLDNNGNQVVNSIAVRNVTAVGSLASGFDLVTGDGTFTDVAVVNSTFTGALGSGIIVNATGDAGMMNPQIDNRTRVFLQGNLITGFFGDGIDIDTSGDASVLATIDSNVINNNGGILGGTLPFFDGISIVASGSSSVNTRITNNAVNGNLERGVDILTIGDSTVNAIIANNNLGGNDQGEDTTNDPIIDSNLEDFRAINSVGSTICLSLSNNFFVFPELLANGGAAADFVVELDGASNGPGFVVPPGITQAPFGSTCEALVTAEELAYIGDGFPPTPPPVPTP